MPRHPLRLLLPVLLLLVFGLLQGLAPGWAQRLEALLVDARFALRGAEEPQNKIAIVALDEASFQILGGLQGENIRTWPRSRWADLVTLVSRANPLLIVLDVTFDTPGWDAGGDDRLATAIIDAGNVILASHLAQQYTGAPAAAVTYSPPIPLLASSALDVGLANLTADIDDHIRRLSPLQPWTNDTSLPALALVAAAAARGAPLDVPYADLQPDASLPIHFRGPEGAFPVIPLHALLSGEAGLEALDGAIVLVGYTTLLEQDRHPAPFGGSLGLPGVEIQAEALDTLLAGDWLHRPPAWLPLLLVLAAVLLGWAAANLPAPNLGIGLFAAALFVYLLAGQALFSLAGFLLPLAGPALAGVLSLGAAVSERMVFAERDKRELKRRFSGMMSPERLDAVLENWEALLDPDRPEKRAAVMFADIRGFTHATEVLQRQGRSAEMVRFLTAYLNGMAQAVFLEGGVVYRTFGDGLLILFGVPEPLPDHALHAVRAAWRMAQEAEALQALWPLQGEGPFQMGIGVNEGPLTDAIVGEGRRFDYTVLGDPVNTAARIESHCKVVMALKPPPFREGDGGRWEGDGWQSQPRDRSKCATILLHRDLYEQVREHITADEDIPPFEAHGKSEPVRVVRLLGVKGDSNNF